MLSLKKQIMLLKAPLSRHRKIPRLTNLSKLKQRLKKKKLNRVLASRVRPNSKSELMTLRKDNERLKDREMNIIQSLKRFSTKIKNLESKQASLESSAAPSLKIELRAKSNLPRRPSKEPTKKGTQRR